MITWPEEDATFQYLSYYGEVMAPPPYATILLNAESENVQCTMSRKIQVARATLISW